MAFRTRAKIVLEIEVNGKHPEGINFNRHFRSTLVNILSNTQSEIEVIDVGVKKDTKMQERFL